MAESVCHRRSDCFVVEIRARVFCGVQPSSSASTFLCFVFGIENIVDWTADFPQKVTEQVDCVRASCHKLDSIIDPLSNHKIFRLLMIQHRILPVLLPGRWDGDVDKLTGFGGLERFSGIRKGKGDWCGGCDVGSDAGPGLRSVWLCG
jgi:hypothetical protein